MLIGSALMGLAATHPDDIEEMWYHLPLQSTSSSHLGFQCFHLYLLGHLWTNRDPYLVKLLFALTPRLVPCSHGVFALPMTWRGLGPLKLKSSSRVTKTHFFFNPTSPPKNLEGVLETFFF